MSHRIEVGVTFDVAPAVSYIRVDMPGKGENWRRSKIDGPSHAELEDDAGTALLRLILPDTTEIEFDRKLMNMANALAWALGLNHDSTTVEWDDIGRPLLRQGDWRMQHSEAAITFWR